MWAEGQYVRLAQAIDAGYSADTPSVVRARYGGQVTGPIIGELGKCLDVRNGDMLNGTPIQVSDCNGTAAQRVTWNTGDAAIHILGKCLDVTGGVSTSGTGVELWDCNATGAQQWVYAAWNKLRNPQSGRCLAVPGSDATSGTQLQIADCDASGGQIWHLP
jgi:hypothetical protein